VLPASSNTIPYGRQCIAVGQVVARHRLNKMKHAIEKKNWYHFAHFVRPRLLRRLPPVVDKLPLLTT
jgi:hypothetical protein